MFTLVILAVVFALVVYMLYKCEYPDNYEYMLKLPHPPIRPILGCYIPPDMGGRLVARRNV